MIASAALLAACGGEDASTSSSPAPEPASQARASAEVREHNEKVRREYQKRRAAEAPTEEEVEAKQTVARFYEVLAAERAVDDLDRTTIDAGSFCGLMSERARAETVRYVEASSGIDQEWDCESAVQLLTIRSKRSGGFGDARGARVIAVNAAGGRASATVRLPDGTATSVPMVKEDGEWKLAAAGVGR